MKLRDRKNMLFPVLRRFEHRSAIFNSVPVYMADKKADLSRSNVAFEHFVFTTETKNDVKNVILAYKNAAPATSAVRRIK